MPPTTFSLQVPAAKAHIRKDSSGGGLETQDIIGIAVGVPSALLALIGVIIAYLTYKKPEKLGNMKKRLNFVGNWAERDVHDGQHYGNRGAIIRGDIGTQNNSFL